MMLWNLRQHTAIAGMAFMMKKFSKSGQIIVIFQECMTKFINGLESQFAHQKSLRICGTFWSYIKTPTEVRTESQNVFLIFFKVQVIYALSFLHPPTLPPTGSPLEISFLVESLNAMQILCKHLSTKFILENIFNCFMH